jgi:hypothetical protein
MEVAHWMSKWDREDDFEHLEEYVRKYRNGDYSHVEKPDTSEQMVKTWACKTRGSATSQEKAGFRDEARRARSTLELAGECLKV